MATNHSSVFTPFSLEISNDITATGIKHIPTLAPPSPQCRPLILLIHGGGCTAHHFDVCPSLTASTVSSALSIPCIAINRPGYLSSTPLEPPTLAITYHQRLGRFLHEQLFPALWRDFGVPNQCSTIVPLAHSLGSSSIIVAAALHTQDSRLNPVYPLAGIIFSGWGVIARASQAP